ncbi:AIPR family protein [Kordiimonas lipolytica]|uniref:AIPR family protein n=1 Tax=Kordiimonas lipolytica TaxID=1662421 RepID=A0ABV8U8Y2_9PROT|nr:AIPR family protein [Kordiimonas lipolytica]
MYQALEEQYLELKNTVQINAYADAEFVSTAFTEYLGEIAANAGDTPDLNSTSIRHNGSLPYRVDGFELNKNNRELVLAITHYVQSEEIQTINAAESDRLFRHCIQFFRNSLSPTFIDSLEESSDDFYLADLIRTNLPFIKRVRIVLFTNAVSSRRKEIETELLGDIPVTKNLFDLVRYVRVLDSGSATEPITIDLTDFSSNGLAALKTPGSTEDYESYLCVMPGELLAKIYETYGTKLLEQNVRVFLQARTKVNKGILETISKKPEMFFAYNNGLTATASEVNIVNDGKNGLLIRSLTNLQIVNGGQTTASILYAQDLNKADLSKVSVQLKLSVIPPEKIEEIVPNISRFSNTQNKVSEADFHSSHPFHSFMDRLSKRIITPQVEAGRPSSKWFYERARGQFRNAQLYMSQSERNRFLSEFPKEQVLLKTDIAKYELSFACTPDVVSRGAQKCFMEYMKHVQKEWEKNQNSFNELFFKELIARAIVFRSVDNIVANADWYKADRGNKAQTVTYTVSYLVHYVEQQRRNFDLLKIWQSQELPDRLVSVFEKTAQMVKQHIQNTPPDVAMVSEYCKRSDCWQTLKRNTPDFPMHLNEYTITIEDASEQARDAKRTEIIDADIELEKLLLQLAPIAENIRSDATRLRLLTPTTSRVLDKMGSYKFSFSKSEKISIKDLLAELEKYEIKYVAPKPDGKG